MTNARQDPKQSNNTINKKNTPTNRITINKKKRMDNNRKPYPTKMSQTLLSVASDVFRCCIYGK